MRRTLTVLAFALISAATPAAAQQSVSFNFGAFTPAREDARSRSNGRSDDVLVNNLNTFAFDLNDFDSVTFGGEWLVALGNHAEAGLGLGFYTDSVDSVDRNQVHEDFTEIEQEFKLRIIPLTATFRFLPLGRSSAVQPYIGGGVGLFRWRYSESGEFVDDIDDSIFRGTYIGDGWAVGPVILGGVRFGLGSWDIGGEIRYQDAEGDLPADQGFSGSKIDLKGFNYLVTFNIRF